VVARNPRVFYAPGTKAFPSSKGFFQELAEKTAAERFFGRTLASVCPESGALPYFSAKASGKTIAKIEPRMLRGFTLGGLGRSGRPSAAEEGRRSDSLSASASEK
jgi:hypothetical protein